MDGSAVTRTPPARRTFRHRVELSWVQRLIPDPSQAEHPRHGGLLLHPDAVPEHPAVPDHLGAASPIPVQLGSASQPVLQDY